MKPLSATSWTEIVKPGSRVFLGSGAACPHALIEDLLTSAERLSDVEITHVFTLGPAPWLDDRYADALNINAFFLGPTLRDSGDFPLEDYTPCNLSDVPRFFRDAVLPLDVALISVSPPDRFGYCSLGPSVDVVQAACDTADRIVAQINPRLPVTSGPSHIHRSRVDYFIEREAELPELPATTPSPELERIAQYLAFLIDDDSTLQVGYGRIGDALYPALSGHRRLGLHTELITDGVMELIDSGVIDNSRKSVDRGCSVTSFAIGSRDLYAFVDRNPHVAFHPTDYVNSLATIARQQRMVAVNSALQVDLTGHAVTDTLGGRVYGGVGGALDFMRGAAAAPNGKPIIALPSRTSDGSASRIVSRIAPGSGIVGTRPDVHYVVTEFGIATLRGRNIRERVSELIQIAHPDFRESLLAEAREAGMVPAYHALTPRTVSEIGDIETRRLQFGDQQYVLRPLHPSDERSLQEFFYSHNAETIHRRYGFLVRRMNRRRAYELVAVDQSRHLALALVEIQGPRQVIHAVGRYYLDDNGTSAEAAFVVRETMRRLGIGTTLLRALLAVARKRGLTTLWAQVDRQNLAMYRLFIREGAVDAQSDDDSVYRVEFDLTADPAANQSSSVEK